MTDDALPQWGCSVYKEPLTSSTKSNECDLRKMFAWQMLCHAYVDRDFIMCHAGKENGSVFLSVNIKNSLHGSVNVTCIYEYIYQSWY